MDEGGSRSTVSLSEGPLSGEPGGGALLLGDPEGYRDEGSEDGHLFPWRPRWDAWGGGWGSVH